MAGPCPLPITINYKGKSLTFKNSTEFKTWMSTEGLQDLVNNNVIDINKFEGGKDLTFTKAKAQVAPEEKTRTRKILERIIEASAIPKEIKEGFLEQGIDYTPVGLNLTKQEALAYVDVYEQMNALDRLETLVKDPFSGFTEDVKSVVLAKLWDRFATMSKEATDPYEKESYKDRAVSIGMFAAERATELGRAVNAQKVWSDFLGRHPELAVDVVQREFDKFNKKEVEKYSNDSKNIKKVFDLYKNEIEANKNNPRELERLKEEIKDELFGKKSSFSSKEISNLVDYMFDHYVKYDQLLNKSMNRLVARTLGLKYVTEQDAKNITAFQAKINASEDMAVTYLNNPTNVNKLNYIKSVREAQIAAKNLNKFFTPEKNFGQLINSLVQGGLLNIKSVLLNIYYNVLMAPLRFQSNLSATAVDYLLSQAAKTRLVEYINDKLPDKYSKYKLSKDRTINVLAAQKGYFSGIPIGLREGISQLRTGPMPDDVQNRELQQSLEIAESWVKAYSRLKGEEKMRIGRLIMELTEGTFGIAPEAMFRLLNLGDKPFKRASERARLFELAWLKKLEGIDLEKFLTAPDKETLEMIEKAGLDATFQNENIVSGFLKNKGSKVESAWKPIGWVFTILRATQFPYVKTPLNVIYETSKFVAPELAGVEFLLQVYKGDRRAAVKTFGTMMTGYVLRYVAGSMVAAGLLSASGKDDDDKERAVKNEYDIPLYLNYTGFLRWMSGGSPDEEAGDNKIALTSLGIIGSILAIHANIAKKEQKAEIEGDAIDYSTKLMYLLPETASNALEQSFLNNANTLLNAIKEGGWAIDKWLAQTAVTLSSAFYPNTLASISRAQDTYQREVRGIDVKETIVNTLKNRMFMYEDLPTKVTLWGERVLNVPEGKNAYAYYLFDIFKSRKSEVPKFGYELYQIYEETNDIKVLPTPVGKEITIGNITKKLSAEEQEELAISVGTKRYEQVNGYIYPIEGGGGVSKLEKQIVKKYVGQGRPDLMYANVIKKLNKLYDKGYELGLKEWLQDTGRDKELKEYNKFLKKQKEKEVFKPNE